MPLPAVTPVVRAARIAVTAAYAAQGLGYAVVVTSLPALKARQSVDDAVVSVIVLGVAVMAALGSIVANAVAVRFGSRTALALGLLIQAVALPVIAVWLGALALNTWLSRFATRATRLAVALIFGATILVLWELAVRIYAVPPVILPAAPTVISGRADG